MYCDPPNLKTWLRAWWSSHGSWAGNSSH